MKVIYEGPYDVTAYKIQGLVYAIKRGENDVPDKHVREALRIPGTRLPEGVSLPKPKKKAKPKATPKPVVVVDMQGDE